MPKELLTGAAHSELRTKTEQRPMLLGHITLNAFIAICTEGFREELYNGQSAFPSNFKERLECRRGKNVSNNLGENTRSNKMDPHGLHITGLSLITYTILTNNYNRNMHTPHSTFLDYNPASFW